MPRKRVHGTGLAMRREEDCARSPVSRVATVQGNHSQVTAYADQVLALLAARETTRGLTALPTAHDLLMRQAATIHDEERLHAFVHDISPGQTDLG